eukprot:CAMPEP_0178964534 /NCGR_PEP_ID=MMETSP0789-20121207/15732_1 /TAXON_ID=3005 /ORGANISM="Rhizosolenia setigera, Strain CCMP 1694" /LENGTH=131 /DNA_ID=CAMNT_0020649323 /DNA_START=51 /DNA_END=446 /DNA_ORIENTATION=+
MIKELQYLVGYEEIFDGEIDKGNRQKVFEIRFKQEVYLSKPTIIIEKDGTMTNIISPHEARLGSLTHSTPIYIDGNNSRALGYVADSEIIEHVVYYDLTDGETMSLFRSSLEEAKPIQKNLALMAYKTSGM